MRLFISPGFLAWMGILIVGALVGIFYCVPRVSRLSGVRLTLQNQTLTTSTLKYGKSNMYDLSSFPAYPSSRMICWAHADLLFAGRFTHIGICSLIGGLSVSCTQGLGASILTSIRGNNQVTFWFFWFLLYVVLSIVQRVRWLRLADTFPLSRAASLLSSRCSLSEKSQSPRAFTKRDTEADVMHHSPYRINYLNKALELFVA